MLGKSREGEEGEEHRQLESTMHFMQTQLASVESVKTACACIAFFYHHFKHYGQNSGALFNS